MLDVTNEIKSRLNIVEVVREYIKLNQAGTNFKALCPFHNEKTSSFMVSPEKQIWHCFGCGEGGDIFGFVMKIENLEFIDALRLLAKKAGVKLTRQDPNLANLRSRLSEIMSRAVDFYQAVLWQSPLGETGRKYLVERQINPETAKDFKLGFAPNNWTSLLDHLKNKGFSENDILAAGLILKKESSNSFYDRFRGRLIFPIIDAHGQISGLGGRTMALGGEEEKTAKYINTPQTLIYNKSQSIYGIDKAKLDIRKKDLAVMVEGYFDVISSHQAGVKNVVATSGTALTPEHLKIIKRYTNNIALAFDADTGGQSAAVRGVDLVLEEGMNVKLALIPQGKDPDECIRRDAELWRQAVTKTVDYIDYFFEKTFAGLDLTMVQNKKEAAKILLPVINKIADKVEQAHYLQKLAEKIRVSEQILRESLPRPQKEQFITPLKTAKTNRNQLLAERILALVLKFGLNLEYLVNNLSPAMFDDEKTREIYNNLIIYYTNSNIKDLIFSFNYQEFIRLLNEAYQNLVKYADYLILLAEKDFLDFSEDQIRKELYEDVRSFKKDFFKTQLKKVEEDIKQAEFLKDEDKIAQLIEEFKKLARELSQLN